MGLPKEYPNARRAALIVKSMSAYLHMKKHTHTQEHIHVSGCIREWQVQLKGDVNSCYRHAVIIEAVKSLILYVYLSGFM